MSDQAGAAPITLERNGDAAVARPQMKMMDDQALKTLIRLINEAATPDAGVDLVVLDLSRVTILPSLALGLLVQISNTCKSRAQRLKLVGLQPQIRQVFAITKLDRVFQFADTGEEAIKG